MGKKAKRKEKVNEVLSLIKEQVTNHGGDFLLSLYRRLDEVNQLCDSATSEEETMSVVEESDTEVPESSSGGEDNSSDEDSRKAWSSPETMPAKAKKRRLSGNSRPSSPPTSSSPGVAAVDKKIAVDKTALPKESQKVSNKKAPPPVAPSSQKSQTTGPTSKPFSMPPIVCFRLNVAELSKFTKSANISCRIRNINSNKSVVTAMNRDGHQLIRSFLQSGKTEFNTYTAKEDRKEMLVLKGIHHSFDAEDVKEALTTEGVPVLVVKPFKSQRTDKKFNHFIVELEKNCDKAAVCSKTLLLNQLVHWEKLKSAGITQCRNCQKFGHVASNCGMKYRCVKCKDEHLPGQCPRNADNIKDDNVFCTNCQKNGHPANYKGCPKYKEKMAEKLKTAQKKKEQHKFAQMSASKAIVKGVSFASIAAMGTSSKPATISKPLTSSHAASNSKPIKKPAVKPVPSTGKANIFDDTERLFGADLFTIL